MSQTVNVQDSITVVPSGYDSANSSYSSISSSYPITNAYDDSSSTSYAYITCNTGSSASTYVSFTFNFSEIPSNATIDSITAKAKVRVSSTSYISTAYLRLYNGTTAMGSNTSARTTTATAYTISSPGSWTRATLDNLELRYTGTRGTNNTNRAAYLYFYGADITVNYSISGIQYTLTATSEINEVTISPIATTAMEGETVEFTINPGTVAIEDIKITDNDNEVTSSLIQHVVPTGGTINAVPASYTVSGSISGTRYESTVGRGVDNPSSQTGNDYCSSSGSTATIYYHFNFDEIPDIATIESMTVQAYGHLESTSNSSEVARLNTYYGTSEKGTQISYTSTSSQTLNITPGTWTVAELKTDARVGFTIGYYGGLTTGITWTVVYSVPSSGGDYYYTYTLTNVAADHTIVIEQAGAFVPPEEDPEKTYYPITISSINATTTPANGTTRIEAGSNQTITISPTDPQLTLALDNGVDITSQLVGGIPVNNYTITTQVSGASYGFNLNNSTGYYVSTNNGVGSSASVARVNFDLESDVLVTIQYINQGESQADYGMFGKIDTTVSTTGNTYSSSSASPDDPNNYYYMCAAAADSTTTVKTLTYNISAGEHYIDIKYAKDQASDSGNDSLQWKILSIEATSAGGDYTYTLTNIQQKHSLIFVFGEVNYYFITSSGDNCKLYPDGQLVKLEGDSYHLTIIPDDNSATVSITDNNVDRTSLLEYYEGEDKSGNTIVNYVYRLSNINATHNLIISCAATSSSIIYLKINGNWTICSNVYKKINGSWILQDNLGDVFNSTANYVKSN